LDYFHDFLSLGHKNNFGKTLGQSQCFGIIIGQFRPLPAILWLCEIQTIWDFHYFGPNWSHFKHFWPQTNTNNLISKKFQEIVLNFLRLQILLKFSLSLTTKNPWAWGIEGIYSL
jgi:hypothetical protein